MRRAWIVAIAVLFISAAAGRLIAVLGGQAAAFLVGAIVFIPAGLYVATTVRTWSAVTWFRWAQRDGFSYLTDMVELFDTNVGIATAIAVVGAAELLGAGAPASVSPVVPLLVAIALLLVATVGNDRSHE